MSEALSEKLFDMAENIPEGKLKERLSDAAIEAEELENEASAECENCGDFEELEEELHEVSYEHEVLVDAKREIKNGNLSDALNLIDRCLPKDMRYA